MKTIYCVPGKHNHLYTSPGFGSELDIRFQPVDRYKVLKLNLDPIQCHSFLFDLNVLDLDDPCFCRNFVNKYSNTIVIGIKRVKTPLPSLLSKNVLLKEILSLDDDISSNLSLICKSFSHWNHINDVSTEIYKNIHKAIVVGTNSLFINAVLKIPFFANSDTTVLIYGETGTGKELFARAFHYLGKRSGKPFITVDCASLPETLIENELFGHQEGAYTGAGKSRKGLLEESDGGTVFLDEIESLSLSIQAKLLRFIQEKEFKPVGSNTYKKVNARIVTATNDNLQDLVQKKQFRKDLYYRLNTTHIRLPAVRERKEDIPLLINYFLRKFSEKKSSIWDLPYKTILEWQNYAWPGNVREIQNCVQDWLLNHIANVQNEPSVNVEYEIDEKPEFEDLHTYRQKLLSKYEQDYLHRLLTHTKGNISRAAECAGMNRKNLSILIKKYGIDSKSYR